MIRRIVAAVCAVLCLCIVFSGCVNNGDKMPDQYNNIRWETPDYSFIINPSDDCKGSYTFNGTKYNIKVNFSSHDLTVNDTDKNDAELFYAQWKYEGDMLFIYDIAFNTKDYKDFKENYSEYVTLKKAKLK